MSFTYSVTAWGFEASRASTSSALRSDLSGFLPASAATESPALVMSPKTARLVRVAMGCAFLVAGRGLVQARCERRGGGGGRRASAAACGGGYARGRRTAGVSRPSGALWCWIQRRRPAGAPRRRAGAAQHGEMAVCVSAECRVCAALSRAQSGQPRQRSSGGAQRSLWVRRGKIAAAAACFSVSSCCNGAWLVARCGGSRQPSAARLLGGLSIPRAPTPPPPEVSTAAEQSKQYGFRSSFWRPLTGCLRARPPCWSCQGPPVTTETAQHRRAAEIRRSRGCRVDKTIIATKNATRPRGDDTA